MRSKLSIVFYRDVEGYLDLATFLFALVLLGWAFVHAVMQRADAFSAVGALSKNAWLGILGGLMVGTIIFFLALRFQIVMYVGIGAAAYYLLETRRGIKDVSEGPW